jgi:hypothetical protein
MIIMIITRITMDDALADHYKSADHLLNSKRLKMSGAEKAGMKRFILRLLVNEKLLLLYNEGGAESCSEDAVKDLDIYEVDAILKDCIYCRSQIIYQMKKFKKEEVATMT